MSGTQLRAWELRGIVALFVLFVAIPLAVLAVPGLWSLLFAWLAIGLCAPMTLAAWMGGNPYSPESMMVVCDEHQFKFYRDVGCRYCARDRSAR